MTSDKFYCLLNARGVWQCMGFFWVVGRAFFTRKTVGDAMQAALRSILWWCCLLRLKAWLALTRGMQLPLDLVLSLAPLAEKLAPLVRRISSWFLAQHTSLVKRYDYSSTPGRVCIWTDLAFSSWCNHLPCRDSLAGAPDGARWVPPYQYRTRPPHMPVQLEAPIHLVEED